ncbi:MAG: hypothetical protein ACKO40_03160 [Planctomycetaceae bacterium]
MMRRTVAAVAWVLWLAVLSADAADVVTPDPALRVVPVDTVERASFLGVRVDSDGRVFVGGREALFVYEPDGGGGYGPRRTLLTFPDHTWIHDIEILGDDLYLLTVSGLYHVPGGRRGREGLEPRRLLWGVPRGHTHQCFHGMAFGPEGDLYVGMGDPLWYYGDFTRPDHWGHWTFFTRPATAGDAGTVEEWQRTPYTGVGAVLRLRLRDGALRVVAEGLRNDCGLAFDRDWNLFTNDNDHESLPADYVPGRLLHVSSRAWFGWPRGWSPEKTPDRLDLRATMNPALGRFVPVGQAYYDDEVLPPRYRNSLLVARWCTRQVTSYPLEGVGATFRAPEHELLAGVGVARPVGIAVGRGGRLFVTVCHMDHNEDSPVYRSDLVMITTAGDRPDHPFRPYDSATATAGRLFTDLTDPAWSIRREAHAELLRRRDLDGRDLIARYEAAPRDGAARDHLLWLVAMRAAPDAAWNRMAEALGDARSSTRLQAVRAVAERFPDRVATLVPLLGDPDPQVVHAVVGACFEDGDLLDDDGVVERLVTGPARSHDSHLRQAAVRLLGARLDGTRLQRFADAVDPDIRLAAVLAAGFRLTVPESTATPAEHLPLAAWRNADASCRLTFADGSVDLRDLGRLGTFTLAEHWKAGGRTRDQESLFAGLVSALDDDDPRTRRQAASFLAALADPRCESRVSAVLSETAARPTANAAMATTEPSMLDRGRPPFDPAAFVGVDWAAEMRAGNAERGRTLFGAAGIGCVKCHAMSDDAAVAGGPSLAGAARRFTVGYLVESVLEPDKVVAPLFRATTVVTTDGRSLTGLVTGETADRVQLIMPDGTSRSIAVTDIAERAAHAGSPMPRGLVRTRQELRDILAYLLAVPSE